MELDKDGDSGEQSVIDPETARKLVYYCDVEPGDHLDAMRLTQDSVANWLDPTALDDESYYDVGDGQASPGCADASASGAMEQPGETVPTAGVGKSAITTATGNLDGKPLHTGFNVDPVLQETYKAMREASPVFTHWADIAENAPDARHVIQLGKVPGRDPVVTDCNALGYGCKVTIDPDKIFNTRYVTTDGDTAPMTMERAIAHEIRHVANSEQTGAPFKRIEPFSHSRIINDENRMMREIDPYSPQRSPDDDRLYVGHE